MMISSRNSIIWVGALSISDTWNSIYSYFSILSEWVCHIFCFVLFFSSIFPFSNVYWAIHEVLRAEPGSGNKMRDKAPWFFCLRSLVSGPCCKVEWNTICPMSASAASSPLPSHAPPAAVVWAFVSLTGPQHPLSSEPSHWVFPMPILPPSNSTPYTLRTHLTPLNSSPT